MYKLGQLVFLILLIIVGPVSTIWMFNTLFMLGIAYTFKTWIAAWLFNISIIGVAITARNNK